MSCFPRAVSATWSRPLEDAGAAIRRIVAARPRAHRLRPQTTRALAQRLARFCAVEHAFAVLVRLVKAHIADALGIALTHPRARELLLVDYVPSGVRLTRSILREARDIELMKNHRTYQELFAINKAADMRVKRGLRTRFARAIPRTQHGVAQEIVQ